ncbi:MAG: cell division topological specificity factor MinE [Kofleriaceae bacterium]|nr:cell division topological specificity factor MinE [Kofleriaceae bacterium]
MVWNDIKGFLSGGRRSSREVAKGRLHLVLAHDRTGLDGAKLQEMRQKIADVIAEYVDIDADAVDIQIERVSRESTELRVSSPVRTRNSAVS